MATPTKPSRGAIAVVGGLHAWPLLRSYSEQITPIADSVDNYDGAKQYVDEDYGTTVLAPVQLALNGAFDDYSTIIFDRDHVMAYLYIVELRRRGLLPAMAPVYLFDFIVDSTAAVLAYSTDELTGLRKHLERVSYREWDADRFAEEMADERRLAQALADVQQARRDGRVDAVEAKTVLALRRSGSVDDAIARIRQLPETQADGLRTLLVPSLSSADTQLHELVAHAGGRVIEENDWYGSRSVVDSPAAGHSLDALAAELLTTAATDRISPTATRLSWFTTTLQRGVIDVVVVITDPRDGRRGWDIPALRRAAEAHGVPFVWVHAATASESERTAALEQLRAEFDSIRSGR